METRRYQYSPLERNDRSELSHQTFRILHLLPRTSPEDAIRLEIEIVQLDQSPPYEALSYVWGPQYPSDRIWFGKEYVEVGPSLISALLHLRLPDKPRTLWIDRLAIDQSNIGEREDQVGLMGKIYSLASKVIVWLGSGDAGSGVALKTIEEIATQVQRRHRDQPRSQWDEGAQDLWHDLQSSPSKANAVRNLLRRPWFGRVWTFQEIVLARHAEIHCGNVSISWNSLQAFLAGSQRWKQGPNIEDNVFDGADANAMLMVQARTAQEWDLKSDMTAQHALLGFMPLLHGMRNYGATDPRDRVYALLNVAVDVGEPSIAIDYSQSIMEVYATATRWLIRKWKSLAVLNLVETKDAIPLVSWVPDFRSQDPMNFWRQPRLIQRGAENRIYQASGDTEAFIRSEILSILTVRGIRVGRITARTEPSGNINPPNIVFGPHVLDGGSWQLFARAAATGGTYRHTQEPIDTVFERIRVADLSPGERLERIGQSRPMKPLPRIVPERFSYVQVKGTGNFKGPTNDIGANVIRATFRRRMFLTDSGYLGLGHRSLQVGDEVFILFGADAPFVLRKINEGAYMLRGDAYVHGVMDGELVNAHSADFSYPVIEIQLF